MLNLASKQKGFTLIELMIGLVILAILLSAGLPSFTQWIQNTHTRTGAESILNGLQLARSEAITRNANVRFTVTSTGGQVDWQVGCVIPVADFNADQVADCPADIRSRSAAEGAGNARIGASNGAIGAIGTAIASGTGLSSGNTGVTFNFLGRVAALNADFTRLDVTNSASANARRMVILIGAGGTIRMCDPAVALADNPQGCA